MDEHRIRIAVGYEAHSEGLIASCDCGWNRFVEDGADLADLLLGHREQAERILELADIGPS